MTHRSLLVSVLVFSVLAFSAAPLAARAAQETKATEARVQKDVEYGTADGESLKLDLYLPAEKFAQKRPGIVFLHGGGWSGGDKGEFAGLSKEMAGRGYVAATVNYRLAPKYKFPAALLDIQMAVRWLRSHAAEFNLDPNRVGAMGSSAGGNLASMLGVMDTYGSGGTPDAPPSRVNCVVDYYGRMDLTMKQGGHDYRIDFIGKSLPEGLELYKAASPVFHVDSKTVPFLIVQGGRDSQVMPDQSQRMLNALEKADIEASLMVLSTQGHGFGGAQGQLAWNTAKLFLDSHLKP